MLTKRIITGLFLFSIVFEILNWIGVLHFQLSFSWFGLVGTSGIILAILCYFDPRPLIWVAAFAGVTSDIISNLGNFYNRFDWWDRPVHAFGGFCTAIIVYYSIRAYEKRGTMTLRGPSIIYATLFTVCSFGFIYEYWEHLVDIFYFQHQKELGDGPDTVDDMVMNVLGAAVFLLIIILWRRYKDKKLAQQNGTADEQKNLV